MGKKVGYRKHEGKTKYTSKMSGTKRAKHWPRKGARRLERFDAWMVEGDKRREESLRGTFEVLCASIPDSFEGPRPVSLRSFGGGCPTQADGFVDTGEGWYFRFRHDVAELRVFSESLIRPRLRVGTYPLTGTGDAGDLGMDEGVRLIGAMWEHLGPGTREGLDPELFRGVLDPASLVGHEYTGEDRAPLGPAEGL
jgi:hypothetical protein